VIFFSIFIKFLKNYINIEPVPKLIDCALTRTVLRQALAVFQPYKTANFKVAFPKPKFWESL
jgi:hypothetical protein